MLQHPCRRTYARCYFTRGEAHLTPLPYVCPQLAAKVIGDEALAKKFEDSVQTIRRDIMFAASLYI